MSARFSVKFTDPIGQMISASEDDIFEMILDRITDFLESTDCLERSYEGWFTVEAIDE